MEENHPPSKCLKLFFDDTNGVVQLVREQPPEQCILKVESFTELQGHFKSLEFKAGGYTWVLSVFPKGNKDEDGAGHLSLYVEMVDKISSGTFVNATLRLFIYDQIRDNYLVFQDISDKRFHDLKSEWGIPKVLPLDSFTDASNGFLVHDCCVFGAEVLIRDCQIKRSIVSLLKATCDRSHTWTIKNFYALKNERSCSPLFSFGEWSWKVLLYPDGNVKSKGKDLSLFLRLVNIDKLTQGSKLYSRFRLCIKNQGHRKDITKTCIAWFSSGIESWGNASFLSIIDLHDTSQGFLVNDTLIVEAKIDVMFLLKDMESSSEV